MAISTQSIIDRASKLLLDEGSVKRWSEDELLEFLNMGQNEIVILKPDVSATIAEYEAVAGTKQTLPDGSDNYKDAAGNTLPAGVELIRVVRNMGVDGLTPGRAITIIDPDILDMLDPDWHNATGAVETLHYVFNNKAPKHFYVYPPKPDLDPGYFEIAYASIPFPCSEVSDTTYISLSDIYSNILLDYILYRALAKENSVESNSKAVAYYQSVQNALGLKDNREEMDDPNTNTKYKSKSYK